MGGPHGVSRTLVDLRQYGASADGLGKPLAALGVFLMGSPSEWVQLKVSANFCSQIVGCKGLKSYRPAQKNTKPEKELFKVDSSL